jgi:CubicO group peptidase (beta-lactamase class C family)
VEYHEGSGAALSIRIEGDTVVDVWAGLADARNRRPWTRETVAVLFSATKGLLSILTARLVQEGSLDFDAHVSQYWPEFADAGKSRITVRQLLAHQAGLSAPVEELRPDDVLDWQRVVHALETQAPLWEPGEKHAYHALTFGWLAGELIHRVTGVSVGEYFRTLITDPLGVDAWIGVPREELKRIAFVTTTEKRLSEVAVQEAMRTQGEIDWLDRALTLGSAFPSNLVRGKEGFNDRRVLTAEVPGAGGVATARALATIWSATVSTTDGVRLLSDDVIADATAVQSEGEPFFGGLPPFGRWGTGFEISSPAREYLSEHSFGHNGSGGQVGFADPQYKAGFAFVTNMLETRGDERAPSIVRALRGVLDDRA